MKKRRPNRLALYILVALLPLAVLGVGLIWLSYHWPPTPPARADGWQEWDRGLATWYDGPGDTMRNGEKLDLAGLTCAIDAADWAALKGKTVRVRRPDTDDPGVLLRVTDTGYLKDAGLFFWDPLAGRFRPTLVAGWGEHVVVDIPRDTHQRLYSGRTVLVVLEVREDEMTTDKTN